MAPTILPLWKRWYRRYKRLKEQNEPFPQLIIIDGGKGQLSSSLKALEKLELRGKIAIVGIAKRLKRSISLATLCHFISISARNLKAHSAFA